MKSSAPAFVFGALVGAIVVTIVGFTNDWVVTTEARDTQVKDARIDAQAAVCAALVEDHLQKTKKKVDLFGYDSDARQARNDLATRFAVALPGEESADSVVVNACARMLNKPAA